VYASSDGIYKQVSKTSCIQQSEYAGKTLDEQKKILIEQAKREALEELYGTMIFSATDIKNGKLTSDEIRSRAVGSVRVKGNPHFYNGQNLGSICSDVNVYITKSDLEKYTPKEVKLSNFCFNDPSVAVQNIKDEARAAAYKEMIVKFKPSLKNISKKQAEKLIHGFKESNSNFDFNTASYCFNAVGTILPFELEVSGDIKGLSKKRENNKFFKSCKDIKEKFTNSKNGVFTIKPADKSYKVFCDMESDGGGWTKVFHHNVVFGTYKNNNEAFEYNTDKPDAHDKYSILSRLEQFRRNGKLTFKIEWKGLPKKNIWSQVSNPTYEKIRGYSPINVQTINEHWGGLELSSDSRTFIEGSVNHAYWYYAIGVNQMWKNGIPAYISDKATKVVDLYVK